MLAAVQVEHQAYMPIIHDASADPTATPSPTHTRTPRPPTRTPTPMPTIVDGEGGETWAYIGYVNKDGSETLIVAAIPGFCYYLEVDHFEQFGKLVVMRSQKIKMDTWPCVKENYNPDADWPPPEYPVPTVLPPDFGYGESWVSSIPVNVKFVCGSDGAGGTLNCLEVE